MLLVRQLHSIRFCRHLSDFCGLNCTISSNKIIRQYATKKSNNRDKKRPQITITAKTDFVTHQLNSSVAAHLKRQQKMWNEFQKEEQKVHQMRKTDYYFNKNTGKLEQTRHHRICKSTEKQNSKRHIQSTMVCDETESDENEFSDNESDDYSLDELDTPNWEDMELVAINKNFYKPSELTESRSLADISKYRTKMNINYPHLPKPILKFHELRDLSEKIMKELHANFQEFTPIQAQAIPIVLSGRNMIATSKSRSGKTLALILSAVIHISHQPRPKSKDGPVAVILTLTEEMVEQIQKLSNIFCDDAKIKCTVLCNHYDQIQSESKPIDAGELLISTPYHMYEYLRTKSLRLHRCSHFAIYEADKMHHMCLDDEILQILSQIRPDCQTVLWSETWANELKKFIIDDNHVRLDIGSSAVEQSPLENIKQIVKVCDEKQKSAILVDIINSISSETNKQKTLIFTDTPNKADEVANILQRKGYHSKSLHNRKSTIKQNGILSEFHNETFQYLVLTDLAAKNIDFSNISTVVNYDMPIVISDYVNRVNRTGRLIDRTGISYSIVTEEDGDLVDDLIITLKQSNLTITPGLFILKAANTNSDEEITFAVPKGKSFQKFTICNDDVKD